MPVNDMAKASRADITAGYRRALDRRANWETHWRECYEFALPQRSGDLMRPSRPGEKRTERLFDGTAPDAVDQLASILLVQLTPAGGHWFSLRPGPDVADFERQAVSAQLEQIAAIIHSHFERSNFAVEAHQCLLDLVTAGTASLLFEEAPPGHSAAFRFTAVPLAEIALEDSGSGRLDVTYRRSELTAAELIGRFPDAASAAELADRTGDGTARRIPIVEAVFPAATGHAYRAALLEGEGSQDGLLAEGTFSAAPFINFRWLKAPGEAYGRSPVMKALPDIKTANKVVELVLKNASIAVTGIWQADDDGVLNPANIQLVPGTIIPKAVGSAGLTPLEAPGRFDISELVLEQLRERIRKALFVDQLGPVRGPQMTATEVLERTAEASRVLSAVYARLQCEFLTPLVDRAVAILARRGEVPPFQADGRRVVLDLQSPHSRYRAQLDAQNTLAWLNAIRDLGSEAAAVVDPAAAARWLAQAFGVPNQILRDPAPATAAALAETLIEAVAVTAGEGAQLAVSRPASAAPAAAALDGEG